MMSAFQSLNTDFESDANKTRKALLSLPLAGQKIKIGL